MNHYTGKLRAELAVHASRPCGAGWSLGEEARARASAFHVKPAVTRKRQRRWRLTSAIEDFGILKIVGAGAQKNPFTS
jgi:hypothetical protein